LLLHELGGGSESWREVIPLMATDRRVIAVDMRCAGRSEKPPGAFTLADVADDLNAFLAALGWTEPVDVIGAALGSLVGALLTIRDPDRARRLLICAVAPDMAGPTRAYLADRAEKVRMVGMRGVAEASLANSFPATHPAQRAAYRAIYLATIQQPMPSYRSPSRGWRLRQPIGGKSGRRYCSRPGRTISCGRPRLAARSPPSCRARPAAKAECPLSDQTGDLRRDVRQRARGADERTRSRGRGARVAVGAISTR
jgi:pimeloyl-ACP methyl ester carboxylesterase